MMCGQEGCRDIIRDFPGSNGSEANAVRKSSIKNFNIHQTHEEDFKDLFRSVR